MGVTSMGHWYRSRQTYLDDCRSLCINRMSTLRAIPQNGWASGTWTWSNPETGEKTSSIGYEANTLDPDNMYLRIHYTLTEADEKVDYKIKLVSTLPRYGGRRFWFICPYRGRRVAKLYLPYGALYFASRYAYGLKYASQSANAYTRAIKRMWKLKNQLGGDDFPSKPVGMHKSTFQRILAAADAAEETVYSLERPWGAFKKSKASGL